MNIAVFANPNAGKGRAMIAARKVADRLTSAGHAVRNAVHANPDDPTAFQGADVLIIVGGDGTVHRVLSAAAASGVPVYTVPMGTENLFAREFGMDRNHDTLTRALKIESEQQGGRTVDLGVVGTRHFAVMASFGPDASVIHRLSLIRKGSISHASYIRPILAEARKPHLPELTVCADGEEIVHKQRGLLIVANSRQYALRVDPAFNASVDDGKLDIVFFPANGPVRAFAWLIASRLRIHLRNDRVRYLNAANVTVTSDEPLSVQADGEAITASESSTNGGRAWDLSIRPGSVRVLRSQASPAE